MAAECVVKKFERRCRGKWAVWEAICLTSHGLTNRNYMSGWCSGEADFY